MANVARTEPAARVSRASQKSRRDVIESTLKEFEERHRKSKRVPLAARIAQAGLTWSKRKFFIISGAIGLGFFALGTFVNAGLLVAAALAFAGAFGVPFWLLSFLKKRRETKFLNAFPDAVDIIVRGVKAGLPLLDSLKMITTESSEPLRSEFRAIVETQAIGMPLGEACAKLYERMPLAEANFFAIVIAIQQRAGGNLAEALGNLSRVLRDRKKMKAKIRAMSQEAKASAGIIGALPIAVMIMVYISSPTYISLLWTESLGRLMLAGSALWMLAGVLVMKKMINFDF
jgi:tight adherence protein B